MGFGTTLSMMVHCLDANARAPKPAIAIPALQSFKEPRVGLPLSRAACPPRGLGPSAPPKRRFRTPGSRVPSGRTQPRVAPSEEYHSLDLHAGCHHPVGRLSSRWPGLQSLCDARLAPYWLNAPAMALSRVTPVLACADFGARRWCSTVNTATPSSPALGLTYRVQIKRAGSPVLQTTNRLRSVRTTLPWD
jgi:hypothetical protein